MCGYMGSCEGGSDTESLYGHESRNVLYTFGMVHCIYVIIVLVKLICVNSFFLSPSPPLSLSLSPVFGHWTDECEYDVVSPLQHNLATLKKL